MWISCGYVCGWRVDSVVLSGARASCYRARKVRAIRRNVARKAASIKASRGPSNSLTQNLTMLIGGQFDGQSVRIGGRSPCRR